MEKKINAAARQDLRRTREHELGQALVEMVLCASIYVLIMVGIMDMSRVLFRVHQLSQVAREGARIASMTGSPATAGKPFILGQLDKSISIMGLSRVGAGAINVTISEEVIAGDTTTKLVKILVTQLVGDILKGASIIPGFETKKISATISMPQFVLGGS